MHTLSEVVAALNEKAQPDQLEGMVRYGMAVENRLGIKIPVLRRLAKEIGVDHDLAIKLWRTGIAEAKILASMIDDPQAVTAQQMEEWVHAFDSWDVCDQICLNLFDKTPLVWEKIRAWSTKDEEYVKRAAFALIAAVAWHYKQAEDAQLLDLLPVIQQGALDERNYVKKGVSWALRHIGKRNRTLNTAATALARKLAESDSKTERWIGKDVLKDITRASILERLHR